MADEFENESMMLPLALAGAVVVFLIYVCCGPGSAPTEGKERPHSMGSTSALMKEDKSD